MEAQPSTVLLVGRMARFREKVLLLMLPPQGILDRFRAGHLTSSMRAGLRCIPFYGYQSRQSDRQTLRSQDPDVNRNGSSAGLLSAKSKGVASVSTPDSPAS